QRGLDPERINNALTAPKRSRHKEVAVPRCHGCRPSCSAHWDELRPKTKVHFPADSPRLASGWHPRGNRVRQWQTEGTIMDAKSGASTQSGQLTVGNKSWSF